MVENYFCVYIFWTTAYIYDVLHIQYTCDYMTQIQILESFIEGFKCI